MTAALALGKQQPQVLSHISVNVLWQQRLHGENNSHRYCHIYQGWSYDSCACTGKTTATVIVTYIRNGPMTAALARGKQQAQLLSHTSGMVLWQQRLHGENNSHSVCNHRSIIMQTATPWTPPFPQAELFWQNPKHTTHDRKGPEQFTTT